MPTVKMKVWTRAYRPFIFGGNVYAPVLATVTAEGPHDLGGGFKGFVVTSPQGKTFIAESKTGAFVGPSLARVRADIASADPAIMRKQIAEAVETLKGASPVTAKEFWRMLSRP